MNKKQWTGLLFVYVGYLCFGASIFHFLEEREEDQQILQEMEEYNNITEQITRYYHGNKAQLYRDLSQYCGKNVGGKFKHIRIWDYYNSFFFVVTVVSTIGYGNLHPSTALTRILMIFYAIIGIPLNGILLTSLAQFFSNVFIQAHKKYKRYESRFGLAVDVLTYLIPGFLLFIFLPAGAFMYFEDWTFDMAVYYAFVTLTTIGFGDLVAGQKAVDNDNYLAYQIILMCWVLFGLGYLIMLLGFVTRAMSSKKMMKLEHKLVEALTHNKLWNGISKDIGILRRLINELNLDKIKPVFQDDELSHHQLNIGPHKSKSLPDLSVPDESFPEDKVAHRRRRALSEFGAHRIGLNRVFSENDLLRIDRKATFGTSALLQPTELLRQVVDALGGSRAEQDDSDPRGVDVFSDEEVLESEGWYKPPIPSSELPPGYLRSRAHSECPVPKGTEAYTNEKTWSGPAANNAHDLINQQRNKENISDNERSRRWMNPLRRRLRVVSDGDEVQKTYLAVPDLQQKRCSLQDGLFPPLLNSGVATHYMTHTAGAGTGARGLGLPHERPGLTRHEQELYKLYSSGDHVFSAGNRREILEETSIADFLRVLTSLHSRVGERLVAEDFKPKQRKLGTASLTPPRINSLINLFPEPQPEPAPKPRRKFSLMPNIFIHSASRRNSSTEGPGPLPPEKLPEHSNLKRLGRFLLRSYSLTPKGDSNPDVSLIPGGKSKPKDCNSNGDIPSIVIQVDTPHETLRQADKDSRTLARDVFGREAEPIRRSNTIDPASTTSKWPRIRRGSSPSAPSTIIDLNPSLHDHLKTVSGSTESVFNRPANETTATRRHILSSPRWRRGRLLSDASAMSSLSDVKECQ